VPKISVIVPVYNVEKYLSECLDSILNQTFSDIEVICVNDGSKDNSRNILEEYKQKDSRIKIVDKENGGLSSARNAGMKVATGEFLSFIDSDDWVDKTMLEKLYNNITTLNTDIAICGVYQYDETNQKLLDEDKYFTLGYFDKSFDNRAFSYEDTTSFIMDVCVMAWNKLYRRSLIDECNAWYPDGLIFEDGPFFFSLFFKTQRVSIVRDLLYYYRINRIGSIVQRGGKQFLDIIDVVELMYNSIKDSPCFDKIKNEFYCRKADDIVYRYDLIDIFLKGKFSKKLRTKTFLFDPEIFDFDEIKEKAPMTYRHIRDIRDKSSILNFYITKFKIAAMYKVMQILYTEENIYYFKYRKLVLRLKKRANLYDVWYANDRIYIVLFSKIKINFKFEYSKLEQK
jgi:glycosyltransferase involved in cell wall biosynthesis